MRLLLLLLSLSLPACALAERVGVSLLSERVNRPDDRVLRDLAYVEGAGRHERHRLDFFLPDGKNWPVIVFIHGGGWTSGDKNRSFGGLDVFGNIGRYYASRGIGVAVINYRLQPEATWQEQAEDAARAVAWTRENAPRMGGDPSRLFVMGHSAGAYFAAYVALNQGLQEHVGLPARAIAGFISVAGAALDLLDTETYRTENLRYYKQRFGARDAAAWTKASPAAHVDENDPPALFIYGENESPGLKRQSERLAAVMSGLGVSAEIVRIPGEDHRRVVLALTHGKKAAVPAVLRFIATTTARPTKTR